MTAALTGWLGIALLVAAVCCAVTADALRQSEAPGGGSGARPAVRRCTWAALALTAAAAVSVVVRFADALAT
ncbi:hypothetical protein [Kineococcus indalonis]|uniref:hypothetical protein n=1 Tax=Kineococcus indalonis TaxID=2696566 RepID=UPI00141371EF|nr:hypothetical protein [Kineococcus indalonis]NAZ86487.1 hypothetical protein [Kineococcus indalonis]